ncbi:MAG: hypothetical protein CSA96_08425 [Bacteroidetes bacterium]|nr:MAG: hypothetical protein CSA96_08425 [Bacteroidota bacterium]
MRHVFIHLSLFLVMLTGISAATPGFDFREGRYNNVCKDLRNDVLLYFVFVDTRTTYPWTEFDILTTIDSIQVAARWLEANAAEQGIDLHIKTDYYIGDEFATISKNLPKKTVRESLEAGNLHEGMRSLSRWGDFVSKIIGESLYIKEKDGIPMQKKPGTKERLIAYLRDEYQVESVAFMLMVNNYFRSDISLAINTLHNDDVEFAVVSYKYPSEIAHNFLHLYGAADLGASPFRRNPRKIRMATQAFPDDIMGDVYARPLQELEMGEFTKYLIGWSETLENEYEPLLTERFTLFK